jgi:hypothetical protein
MGPSSAARGDAEKPARALDFGWRSGFTAAITAASNAGFSLWGGCAEWAVGFRNL